VSLAQLVLAGTAGFLLSPLTENWGVPFPIAPLLAALGAMAIGIVVGLPAVRIRGLPLAVVTLALAVFLEAFWFQNTKFVPASGKTVAGPTLFGLNLRIGTGAEFPRLAFCFMVVVVLVLVGLGVAKLRTSRLGSAMLAVRANERSAAASGINVARTKLSAFAIAAFIAGIGGALFAYDQTSVSFAPFDAILGLGLFAVVYLAGVTSVSGGILAGLLAYGGIVYRGMSVSLHLGSWYDAISGLGLVLTVILNPEGIVGPFHLRAATRRSRRGQAAALPLHAPAEVALELAATPTETYPVPSTNGAKHDADGLRGEGPRPAPARVSEVAALSVQGLSVHYGGTVALDDVTFDVREGTVCGLIGPNGAGKTTLIDAASGFARYTGTVMLAGESLNGLAPHRRARAGLGRTFQAIELWDDLTVGENVGVSSGIAAKRQGDLAGIDATLFMLGIDDLRERAVGELSQGQRQLVSIARALLGRPKLLLLDEPAAGLDSTESLWLGERLRTVCNQGVTILLIDHDMGLVLSLCDEVHVLNFGQLIASGPSEAIRGDATVSDAYLGSTHSQRHRGSVVTERSSGSQ
jgi:ABC-type branched-subunit amino acid transport system ATPase component/ABC-type branched-subunit amino acid transport system permease subunit